MKSLKESIFKESIFSDVEDIANDDTALFEQFLKDNYQIDGSYIIKNGVIDVMGDVRVKNKHIKSLTNGLFRFGIVQGVFYCGRCAILKSLEGAPKEVRGFFACTHCEGLESLEGAPKKVGRSFSCAHCKNLKFLKGSPEKVGGSFSCYGCNDLESLKGAPEYVGEMFDCSYCYSLETLEDTLIRN